MLRRVLAGTTSAVATLAVLAVPATANPGDPDCYTDQNGVLIYICSTTDPGSDGPGGGDSGGGYVPPTCEYEGVWNDFCRGDDACFINDPAAVQDTEENGLDESTKPNEDSYAVYWECRRPDGSTYELYYWNDDQPTVTIEDRIRSAIGRLELPDIEASFSPPTRTLVNLDTWWWAEGAPAATIRGTEALGMVAVAEPRGLQVETGDGTSLSCPMSVTASDVCTHVYRRAGDYTASVSIVYDLSFELNGTSIGSDQIPEEFRTLTVDDDVDVPVREVQTRVTKVR